MSKRSNLALPGKKWKASTLEDLKIRIEQVDAVTFFGVSLDMLPDPDVPSSILECEKQPKYLLSKAERHFFGYLGDAVYTHSNNSTPTGVEFVIFVLSLLGFDDGGFRLHRNVRSLLFMAGKHVWCQADAALGTIWPRLVIQEAKDHPNDAQPLLIAAAMASGGEWVTRISRCREDWDDSDVEIVVPGIIVHHSAIVLYKIPIRLSVLKAVGNLGGKSRFPNIPDGPAEPTVVQMFMPELNNPSCYLFVHAGLNRLIHRKLALRALEAFKTFVFDLDSDLAQRIRPEGSSDEEAGSQAPAATPCTVDRGEVGE